GKMEMVDDSLQKPNGICFSPDYKKLYIVDTGAPPPGPIHVYDVVDGRRLTGGRRFCTMELDGKKGGSDGIRAGFDGVHVFAPEGTRIGLIRLPETVSNLCFGGAKRNRLFMTASQSLYALYVETQGAHIT